MSNSGFENAWNEEFIKKILEYSQGINEINELLKENKFDMETIRQLKVLLLIDATDRLNDEISAEEWLEILEFRLIHSTLFNCLPILAEMLALVDTKEIEAA